VFGVAAFILAVTAIIFMGIGSGSVQPWNYLTDQETVVQDVASDDEALAGGTAAVDTVSASESTPATSGISRPATTTTAV
jgi:hypothetical protein